MVYQGRSGVFDYPVSSEGGYRRILCPFDKEESNFVKLISKTNKVIHSHISEGKDFYNYEPNEHWDCIISNPPFTNKRKIFE